MGKSSQKNEEILNKIQMDKRVKSRTGEAILAEMKSEERLLCWPVDWRNKLSTIFCCITLCDFLEEETMANICLKFPGESLTDCNPQGSLQCSISNPVS